MTRMMDRRDFLKTAGVGLSMADLIMMGQLTDPQLDGLGAYQDGRVQFVAAVQPVRLKWEDPRLAFVVREPFVSKHSGASIVAGMIELGGVALPEVAQILDRRGP